METNFATGRRAIYTAKSIGAHHHRRRLRRYHHHHHHHQARLSRHHQWASAAGCRVHASSVSFSGCILDWHRYLIVSIFHRCIILSILTPEMTEPTSHALALYSTSHFSPFPLLHSLSPFSLSTLSLSSPFLFHDFHHAEWHTIEAARLIAEFSNNYQFKRFWWKCQRKRIYFVSEW